MISVVIPTYNRLQQLTCAIDSALSQTEPPGEIIVVDDCSSDGTREFLEGWQKRDARVRPVFQMVNEGPGGARNRGVTEARGDFVAFLDSDDVWHNNHLQSGAALFSAVPQLDVVFEDIRRVGPDRRPLEESIVWQRRQIGRYLVAVPNAEPFGWFTFRIPEHHVLLRQYLVPMQTMIVRREVAVAYPFHPTRRIAEDYEFTLRIARAGKRFGFIRNVHCEWMIHDGNLISNQASLLYAREQAKVWRDLMRDASVTAIERRLIRRRIAAYRFEEGYAHLHEGNRAEAAHWYLSSLWASPSWRAAKGLCISTLIPPFLLTSWHRRARSRQARYGSAPQVAVAPSQAT